jgi:hypothetical protein
MTAWWWSFKFEHESSRRGEAHGLPFDRLTALSFAEGQSVGLFPHWNESMYTPRRWFRFSLRSLLLLLFTVHMTCLYAEGVAQHSPGSRTK